MPPSLAASAWTAWFGAVQGVPNAQDDRQRLIECGTSSMTVYDTAVPHRWTSGSTELLGENAGGIQIHHLVGGVVEFYRIVTDTTCATQIFNCFCQGDPCQPVRDERDVTRVTGHHLTTFSVAVYDGGSDVNDLTGQNYISHSGAPVAAAIQVNGTWRCIAVAESPDATYAAALAALDLSETSTADIDIIMYDEESAP